MKHCKTYAEYLLAQQRQQALRTATFLAACSSNRKFENE
jgi:hypothetical protein